VEPRVEPTEPTGLPREANPAPGPASAPQSSRLSEEVAALDEAKHALKGGDPALALRQLDAFRAAFPRPTLDAEAKAVRIEALVRAGRRDDARTELGDLEASHPGSPLLDNLALIVGSDGR